MAVKASSYELIIRCKKHPKYRGIRESKTCSGCRLMWILINEPPSIHFAELLNDLKPIRFESQSFPTRIKLTHHSKLQE